MLQNVWDAWWSDMVRIQAGEEWTAFAVAQAADSGWTMDRHALLNRWQRLMQPKLLASAPIDLKGQMQRFASWMTGHYGRLGGLIKRDDG